MFGSVDKANAMAGIGEEGGAGAHGSQVAAFAFDAEILLDATALCHQAHQAFRLMSIELIGDKEPRGLWVGLDGLGDMGDEVGFGARGSNTGSHDLAGSYLQVGDEALRTMSLLFEFLAFDVTRQEVQRWVESLEGLDASHFIRAHHMRALSCKRRGGLIDLTDRADLLSQFGGILSGWREPIALAMRL